jgi:hypothetical protein
MSKDAGGAVKEIFTPTSKKYRVKADLVFDDAKVALAFSRIVSSFETSQSKDRRKNGKLG